MRLLRLFPALALALLAVRAAAQAPALPKFDFYARGPYRASVPRPASLNGYEPGEFQSGYGQIVRVLERIAAAAPDRVRLLENGETWEHRKLYLAVVSTPENLKRLPEIRAALARLADPRALQPEELDRLARETPAVVWLNYGIHGNESASFEAVQQVLFQLAASEEPRTQELLRRLVVVLNPMQNPDGHERFAAWENSVAVGSPEPLSLEHREPYQVSGRGNHYRFDLNRDMLALSQPESRALLRALREWRPQVFADHHGQVESYFFPPSAEPINRNLPLEQTRRWLDTFGRGNAAAFDRHGFSYFVRHTFDLYYAGYLDSWSSLNGAIGMTYETDAGGPRSLALRRDDETILTFRQGIAKHYTASLATLETAADHREALLRDYARFFQTGIAAGRTGPNRRVVLLPGRDPGRAAALALNLVRHGVEVSVSREPFRTEAGRDATGATLGPQEVPAGSYVVDLEQPNQRLAMALLEPDPELDPDFVRAEQERRARNERRGKNVPKEDAEFYDVTSWSLPLAMGVDVLWMAEAVPVRSARLELREPASFRTSHENPAACLAAADGQPLPGLPPAEPLATATAAYVIPYGSDASARLALALLAEDFRLAVATRTLSAGDRTYPPGTLVARVDRNPPALHARIAELSRETGAPVHAVSTGFAGSGDTGIGSPTVVSLKKPKVAVVWDEGTGSASYGGAWYFLERSVGLAFTPVSAAFLRSPELNRFNVVVLPDGSGSLGSLGKEGVDRVKAWIANGGVLIAWGGAATQLARADLALTTSRLVGAEEPPTPGAPPKPEAEPKPGEKQPSKKPLDVPGAAFRATLDRDHFLTYGYAGSTLPVLLEGGSFFRASKEGANVVTFAGEAPLRVAGFVWDDNTETLLRGTSYLIDEPTGRGHVVLFAEDPCFRHLWRTANGLFLNALLFAPAL